MSAGNLVLIPIVLGEDMRIFILFLLFIFAPPILSHDNVGGDIHAVINADGSISYYSKVTPGVVNKRIVAGVKKPEIQLLVGGVLPKAFQIVGLKDEVAGYYVTRSSFEKSAPVAMAIDHGYKAKVVPYDSLPESFDKAYKFTDQKGELGGAWLPASGKYGLATLGEIIPTNWSTAKIEASADVAPVSSRNIPVPEDDFIESLRESMFQQATSLACKSKVLPKEIAVSTSLAASIGFIVGGEGTISFEATWETDKLCNPQ